MSRGRRIAAIVAGSIAGLILIVFVAGIIIVQTPWFRNLVREKIVTAVEAATGGKVDIASFDFDWTHLRARVHGFVVHGLETPPAAPLFSARLVQVDLKLLSPFQGLVDIAYLLVDTPAVDLIVSPDGRTNIPAPKVPAKSSNKTGLETIVDLAIGRFDLRNGSVLFADRKTDFHASGANLRAQFGYNALNVSYRGELDIAPLYLKSGDNPAVNLTVKLPITAERDKVTLTNAELSTPESHAMISGSMDHLADPRTSMHVNGAIALAEVKRALGLNIPLDTRRGPGVAMVDATATMAGSRIQLQTAHLTLGHTSVEASGMLKDPLGSGSARFDATLALGELGALLRVAAEPQGQVQAGGNVRLDAANNYFVTANVAGRNLAFHAGAARLSGIDFATAVTADPHRIELGGLRVSALGGSFAGSASVVELADFRVAGNLSHLDLDQAARAFVSNHLGYDGLISGPIHAEGSFRNTRALAAHASLAIAPGRRGIPVSGHLGVDYNARAGTVMLDHSHIDLPHSTLALSGSLGRKIDVRLVTRDFADFRPIAAIPITFSRGGDAVIDAAVTGSLAAPHVTGNVALAGFAVEGRPFTRFTAAVDATKNDAAVSNAVLVRGPLQAQFSANIGLTGWKPEKRNSLRADLTIRNADVRDVLALAGDANPPVSGPLTADAHITGTIGSPQGSAGFAITGGSIGGERFDSLTAQASLAPEEINVPNLVLTSGPSRISLSATYRHALNDLENGNLTAHVASNQVELAQLQPLVNNRPGLHGILTLTAGMTAAIRPSPSGAGMTLSSVSGSFAIRGLGMSGRSLGDLTASANTVGGAVAYNLNSDMAGSTIHVTGQSRLAAPYQTTASAQIARLPISTVLALAGRPDIPASGILAANAQFSGTLQAPRIAADLHVSNGAAYGQPFTLLQANADYSNTSIDVSQFRADLGPAYVEANGSFSHPVGDLRTGQASFDVRSSAIPLSRIHAIETAQPGIAGTVQITAQGAGTLRGNTMPVIQTLNASFAVRGIARAAAHGQRSLGDLTLTAATRGHTVAFNLTSDFAHSDIRGSGDLDLAAGYPLNAQLNFSGITYQALAPLLTGNSPEPFDASLDGRITVTGPLQRAGELQGSLELTKLEAHSMPGGVGNKPRVNLDLHNDGNIVVALSHGAIAIRNCRIAGPYASLAVTGTADLSAPKTLDVRVDGNIQLEVLEAFSKGIYSSGAIALNAAVTGTTSRPVLNGRLQLQNASFNELQLPNGISGATGAIVFNGTEAVIQNITGRTGGGQVTLAGIVSYASSPFQFRIQANATRVHIEYPQNVTTEATARLTLTGDTGNSLLSGTVTVQDVALHSHSDIGSMLSSAAAPPSSSAPSTGFLAGMHFDIRIQTAPGVQFRTTLTQNLQADANLTLRGTPDQPGMLGRVTVTQGEVIFFGAKYTIDQGTVAFYDPNRINPVLNIDLETTVQGIDVSLSVSGPLDRMKLSYRSDPPMRFQDIVSLLASGKVPTTDPVLAANQPAAPTQSFGQQGASTLLGAAVASPVSGRLQRLFGVTKLSINPEIVGTSNTPQATLTLQQQVTKDVTFTYIQDVSQSNPEAVRIEWSINPHFSAVAQRDIYGEFDLDFYYKKRFH